MAAVARQSIAPHEAPARVVQTQPSPAESAGFDGALITTGGDSRIVLGPNGANRYGCGATPDAALAAFGASTASTISNSAHAAVERLIQRLREETASEAPAAIYRQELDRVRGRLTGLLGLNGLPGLKTILSPSGTDLHRVALHLTVAGAAAAPLVIVPETTETGSGVVAALGGQLGPAAAMRASFAATNLEAALLAPQVMIAPSRLADGTLRPAHEVDEDIATIASTAARLGRRVLLVMMDVSKTGLISPSIACAQDLKQRFPDQVEVMVDACQLRMAPTTLAAYLRQGFMVAVTGSKFMTGPAFSGALFVPEAVSERLRGRALPRALTEACLAGEFPEGLGDAPVLPQRANFGLLARWEAALEEMRRFTALPSATVAGFFASFAEAVSERLAEDQAFEAVTVRPLERTGLGVASCWDRTQTIFPFLLKSSGRILKPVEVLGVHRMMGVDLADWAGWDGAARRVQLGQAVNCGHRAGEPLAALRLNMSARLAVEALAPGGRGPATVIGDALGALDKAAWLSDRIADA